MRLLLNKFHFNLILSYEINSENIFKRGNKTKNISYLKISRRDNINPGLKPLLSKITTLGPQSLARRGPGLGIDIDCTHVLSPHVVPKNSAQSPGRCKDEFRFQPGNFVRRICGFRVDVVPSRYWWKEERLFNASRNKNDANIIVRTVIYFKFVYIYVGKGPLFHIWH